MFRLPPPVRHLTAAACITLGAGGCAQDPAQQATEPVVHAGCMASGDGRLEAELRGALVADLTWKNAEMDCYGIPQPDGSGIRITIAGPLPGTQSRLRFIFGISDQDTARGAASAYPTNLTVIVEGDNQLFATRGNDKCAVESLERTPVTGSGARLDRVKVRGYCIDPASDLAGTRRLLVPTFGFNALLSTGDEP